MTRKRIARLCSIENCERKHWSGGLCGLHHQRRVKWGDPHFVFIRTKGVCAVKDCEQSAHSRGMCAKHWTRNYKYGSPDICKLSRLKGDTPEQRFWSAVAVTADDAKCWEWQRGKTGGYGLFVSQGKNGSLTAFHG